MGQMPQLGLTVMYQANATTQRMAFITQLRNRVKDDMVVCLAVFSTIDVNFKQDVPYSKKPQEGHWSFIG